MVDHALFETDFLAEFRHGFELRLGGMAKKDRRIVVMGQAEDLFDLR